MEKLIRAYIRWFDRIIKKWFFRPVWFIILFYLLVKLLLEIPYLKISLAPRINEILIDFHINDLWLANIDQQDVSILAAFITAILGIAIPISLTVISTLDEKYQQGGITRVFLKEPINITQYFVLFTNIIIIILTMFIEYLNPVFSIIYIIYFVLTVFNFIAYIFLIIDYLTNAKLYIYYKSQNDLNQYFNE